MNFISASLTAQSDSDFIYQTKCMHVLVKYHHDIIPTVYWSNMTYQVCQQSGVPRCDSQVLSVPAVVSLHRNVFTTAHSVM